MQGQKGAMERSRAVEERGIHLAEPLEAGSAACRLYNGIRRCSEPVFERMPMRSAGVLVLVFLTPLIMPGLGCKKSHEIPIARPERLVRTASTWGPQVEGLQCRLRPTKRLWPAGQDLAFKLDLRNQGKRLFAVDVASPIQPQRVALDGIWYRLPERRRASAKVRPLLPSDEWADLALVVPGVGSLPLTSGYHSLAVGLVLEGIDVTSNAVTIEIAPRAD